MKALGEGERDAGAQTGIDAKTAMGSAGGREGGREGVSERERLHEERETHGERDARCLKGIICLL